MEYGLFDVNIDAADSDSTVERAGRHCARPNHHDDGLDDSAVRSPTTPVAMPKVENGTVFVPPQIPLFRRLARNGNVDDQTIPGLVSEADATESEPDCGLCDSSGSGIGDDPVGPRASGGDSSDDDKFDDKFKGLTFHCDSPVVCNKDQSPTTSATVKGKVRRQRRKRTNILKARAARARCPSMTRKMMTRSQGHPLPQDSAAAVLGIP